MEADIVVYGYARVSTVGQDLESQIQELEASGAQKIFAEKFTGTQRDRPEFNKLLAELESGDTLVVTKLDRFARSTIDGLTVIRELFERGVKVHVLNMGIIEDTPTGRLILTIFSGFAEFERDLIVQRTQEGKVHARQRPDFREGRPRKFTEKQIEHALSLLEEMSYREVVERTGISKSTLIRARRIRGDKNISSVT